MSEAVEVGGGLAWRLLATLEGGSLLVATSALIAYTARLKLTRKRRHRTINTVLVSKITGPLGRELKRKLEAQGCTVCTSDSRTATAEKVDALIVIGAESEPGLDGVSRLVTQDVNENLNLLESLSHEVKREGCIAWVCSGDSGGGSYEDASNAFDTVLRASLQYIAKISHCEGIWVGRCNTTKKAVDKILSELFPFTTPKNSGFSIRNTAHKVSVFFGRWLKMIT